VLDIGPTVEAVHKAQASILRVGVSRPLPDFGLGGRGGGCRGRGGRGRVVKYYYILSWTSNMFENGDFWREI